MGPSVVPTDDTPVQNAITCTSPPSVYSSFILPSRPSSRGSDFTSGNGAAEAAGASHADRRKRPAFGQVLVRKSDARSAQPSNQRESAVGDGRGDVRPRSDFSFDSPQQPVCAVPRLIDHHPNQISAVKVPVTEADLPHQRAGSVREAPVEARAARELPAPARPATAARKNDRAAGAARPAPKQSAARRDSRPGKLVPGATAAINIRAGSRAGQLQRQTGKLAVSLSTDRPANRSKSAAPRRLSWRF